MLVLRRFFLAGSFLALCLAACDETQPLDPSAGPSLRFTDTPSDPQATAGSESRIDVTWNDNSTNETGFEVHRSTTGANGTFGLVTTTGAGVTSYSDTYLAASTEYCYKVRAIRRTGRKTTYSDFSTAACATTPVPAAPSATDAKPLNSTTLQVTWVDNSITEEGYRVERSVDRGASWTAAPNLGVNVTVFTDYGRATDQVVYYRVLALNSRGNSALSPVDSTAPPARPTALAATSADAHSVDLTWTDASSVEDGFEVQRAPESWGPWSVAATLPGQNITTYNDAGLASDARYWYRVRALRDGGGSDFSVPANAVTIGSAPPAPTISYAQSWGSSVVAIYWSSATPNTEGFRLERSTDGMSWETAATVAWSQTAWYDEGRTPDQQVCYRVFAFNRLGDSPPSDPAACVTPPAAPTNLEAKPAGSGAIDLTWNDVSRANTGYSVERLFTDCGYYGCYDYWVSIATLGDVASYGDAGLDPTQFYQYRVIALNPGGPSDPSNVAGSFTEPPPVAPSALTAAVVSSSRVDLAWSAGGGSGQEFVVYRCTGDAIACDDPAFEFLSWIATDVTSYSDVTALPATTYTYRVVAYRGGQFSQPSNEASATTLP